MSKLPLPAISDSPDEIFRKCISTFREPKKGDLAKLSTTVASDSSKYENGARDFSKAHGAYDEKPETKKALISVYTEKFAKLGSPGRAYYDRIKAVPKHEICPICGVGHVRTLDHYLPKSHHPTLCVTPANLIPACMECNHLKRDNGELTIHVYFDDIPDDHPWLHAAIQFQPLEPKALESRYFVDCPDSWPKDLVSRIHNHFKVFKLNKSYAASAGEEIADWESKWKNLLFETNQNQLKEEIEANCKSAAATDINSWRSALYRALLSGSGFNTLCAYLESD